MDDVINYGFYSKILNKPFDTLEELKKAELEHAEAEAAKKAKADSRKAEAKVVEDAYVKKTAAREEASRILTAALEDYKEKKKEAQKIIREADDAFDAVLNEFLKKHPEGFHYTFKDGDGSTTYATYTSLLDTVDSLWNIFR